MCVGGGCQFPQGREGTEQLLLCRQEREETPRPETEALCELPLRRSCGDKGRRQAAPPGPRSAFHCAQAGCPGRQAGRQGKPEGTDSRLRVAAREPLEPPALCAPGPGTEPWKPWDWQLDPPPPGPCLAPATAALWAGMWHFSPLHGAWHPLGQDRLNQAHGASPSSELQQVPPWPAPPPSSCTWSESSCGAASPRLRPRWE